MPGVREGELKKTMLKMGISSEDGYIYFNELLYRCMKRVHGMMKLPKEMKVIELKTRFSIFFMTTIQASRGKNVKN